MLRLKLYNTLIFTFLFASSYTIVAQPVKTSRVEYIEKYKFLAIRQMKLSGIPASIIMAQACLESDNGNSRLAVEANNHFGIKCQRSWTGPSIRHDDDALQECFRKYETPEGSFTDHSDFLRYRDRYAFLFNFPIDDYKAWAVGLKKAGYATNPQYAELLIKIIEDNKLYDIDKTPEIIKLATPTQIEQAQTVDIDHYSITIGRKRFKRNGVQYVLARNNDSYENIAIDVDLSEKRVRGYNDNTVKGSEPAAGDVVYIESKQVKTTEKLPLHIAEEGDTMLGISQRYAIKLKYLYKYNRMKAGQEPEAGQEIYLREKKFAH